MRARLLHVLALAPVAAVLAAAFGTFSHAGAADQRPRPVVVAIDPGHGGLPDAAHPELPFDPGAIAASGLMEKDVVLDIGKRLAALLRDDMVAPVLTRHDDRWVDIPTRENEAIQAGAALFVSLHCNSFSNGTVGGSLILYPNALGEALAQTLSETLGRELATSGIGDDGIQLRDNWWIHNPMPTATAEFAYLSNPREAALMATGAFRQQVATALRDGIERADPDIATRRAQILAWQGRHPSAAPPPRRVSRTVAATHPAQGSSVLGTVLAWLIAILVTAALLRWRKPVTHIAIVGAIVGIRVARRTLFRRTTSRHGRRRVRRLGGHTEYWSRTHSVYDELQL